MPSIAAVKIDLASRPSLMAMQLVGDFIITELCRDLMPPSHIDTPVYLDYNATTPVDERVVEVMLPYFADRFGNASSRDHAFGWNARDAVENARAEVASLAGARPSDIVFTSGATESVNLAIKGTVERSRAERVHLITSTTEHPAVLQTCRRLERDAVSVTCLPVESDGSVPPERLDEAIREETVLISLMAANNEIGTVYPTAEFARIARERGVVFFTDATQAMGKIPIDIETAGIDLAAFSAHKLYGPKGVGALCVRHRGRAPGPVAQMDGGGQEGGARSGTLNVAAIVGFGEACRIARLESDAEGRRLARLRDRFESSLAARLPNVWVNGRDVPRLPNTSSIGFEGVDARALVRDMHDVAVSTTSACASGAGGPSHVLEGIGLSRARAYSCVRFSLGRFTTEREMDLVIDRVVRSVRRSGA